jgi:hypothetical protein
MPGVFRVGLVVVAEHAAVRAHGTFDMDARAVFAESDELCNQPKRAALRTSKVSGQLTEPPRIMEAVPIIARARDAP